MTYNPDALVDENNVPLISRLAAQDDCPGGEDGHEDHLNLNGECPWCGVHDPTFYV